ncbi:hypothetical protein KSC_032160 [Ktedonobacter sp. SOSP1-52]|nr:hypothetical protein KSC_032160 [Ktedonobacter sp. SOSP1-52]
MVATVTEICWTSATTSSRYNPSTSGRFKRGIVDVESPSTNKSISLPLLTQFTAQVFPLVIKIAFEPVDESKAPQSGLNKTAWRDDIDGINDVGN